MLGGDAQKKNKAWQETDWWCTILEKLIMEALFGVRAEQWMNPCGYLEKEHAM